MVRWKDSGSRQRYIMSVWGACVYVRASACVWDCGCMLGWVLCSCVCKKKMAEPKIKREGCKARGRTIDRGKKERERRNG